MEERMLATRVADVVLARPDLIEIRFKSGMMLDMAAIRELTEARMQLIGNKPHASLSLMPDDVDFELAVTKVDHYAISRASDPLLAVAVVARGPMLDLVARLYFSYFPQAFPVLTTSDEHEARAWIDARLEKVGEQAV
jgi:hypothetical protein